MRSPRLRVVAFVADRFRRRADSEHEMVINRLIISALLLIYLGAVALQHRMGVDQTLILTLTYSFGGVGFFVHMLVWPQPSALRRIVAMVVDLSALSYCMYLGGETTSLLYTIYLWVIFGNGFRFGLRYLFGATAIALAGFAAVILWTPFWNDNLNLALGLLGGLLVLPAYAATLIRKLSVARMQAEEASRAKSLFLASVSHELRTPLNAVIGMADLMRHTELDAEQREMIGTIALSGRSLLGLIEGILNFSRIEAGRIPLELSDFDLHKALSEVRALLSMQAREKGIAFHLHVDAAAPWHVRGDAKRLQEILVNLCSNAVKFTERGSVALVASVVGSSPQSTRLRFEVIDTGIGIAPEARERIFESFTQADDTIVHRFGGTGLGLTISKELVAMMGGAMGVESQVGSGSVFWLEVPLGAAVIDKTRGTYPEFAALLLGLPETEGKALAGSLAAFGIDTEPLAGIADARTATSRLLDDGKRRVLLFVDARLPDVSAAPWPDAPERLSTILVGDPAAAGLDARDLSSFLSVLPSADSVDALDSILRLVAAGRIGDTEAPASPASVAPARSLSILVADDNRTNQMVISRMLERDGHRVEVVDDGEQAVDAMLAKPFDLVLMDINMPVMNGLEATKLYRFAAIGRDRLPILALTADATEDARVRCLEAGMDACLTKPILPAKLFEAVWSFVPADAGDVPPPTADANVAAIAVHPRFRGDGVARIDETTIEQLRDLGGDQFVGDVLVEFAEEGRRIVSELQISASGGDVDLFRDQIHALRSGAANVGASRLYEFCLTSRAIGAEDFAMRGRQILKDISDEFDNVCAELKRLRGDASAKSSGGSVVPLRRAGGDS